MNILLVNERRQYMCPKCGSNQVFRATFVSSKVIDFGKFNGGLKRIYNKRFTCMKCGYRFNDSQENRGGFSPL